MNGIDRERAEAAAIEREFPGWAAWVGIHGRWYGRRVGVVATPENLLADNDAEGLREEIRRWIGHHS